MRGQFGFEYVVTVSVILLIIAALFAFFYPFFTPPTTTATMQNICNFVANAIDSVANSNGQLSVFYLRLLNITIYNNYNITLSNGTIFIRNPIPSVSGPVSCGSNTRYTETEFFNMSDLTAYYNKSLVGIVYLYGNVGLSAPATIYGGGITGNSDLYFYFLNGTKKSMHNFTSTAFSYSVSSFVGGLASGPYVFSLMSNSSHSVAVNFSFIKS